MHLISQSCRLPQILLNMKRGDSGLLSLTTCVLNVGGCIVRAFTTIVLTQVRGKIMGGVVVLTCAFPSTVLVQVCCGQIVWEWLWRLSARALSHAQVLVSAMQILYLEWMHPLVTCPPDKSIMAHLTH
jgi:hypothetical protein